MEASNSFEGGMRTTPDLSKLVNNTAIDLYNVQLIGKQGDAGVVTNIPGTSTTDSWALRENFVEISSESYNGVAYILSAEVINGVATGKGEIGSYPSPGENGLLVNAYAPFKNYKGDADEFPLLDGFFVSTRFNFSLTSVVEMEIQPDYDASVNVIFTDNVNPMRLINSRFSVLPGGKYEIVDREGSVDANQYTKESFGNTINLISRTRTLLKVAFNGLLTGGSLPAGNYRYYFRYGTQDGNSSDIVAESSVVSVFFGESVRYVRGGIPNSDGTPEKTDKIVSFTLSGLDTSYAYVQVLLVYTSGEVAANPIAYRIGFNYPISSSTLQVVHTGFEELLPEELTTLSLRFASIDTVKSIAQIGGYLVAANITEKNYGKDLLQDFAKRMVAGSKEVLLDSVGTENLGRLDEPIVQDTLKSGTAGWNAGYANAMNIYHRLGYFGGEAYPFGFVYIFSDYSLSKVFPVLALDEMTGATTTPTESQVDILLTAISAADNRGFSSNNLQNVKGIYRFPERSKGTGDLLNGELLRINGVTFRIPLGPKPSGTLGGFFVRAERRPDLIAQGYIIPTLKVGLVENYAADHANSGWIDVRDETRYKVVPIVGSVLEAVKYDIPSDYPTGLSPFEFSNYDGNDKPSQLIFDTNRWAFISNDVIVRKDRFAQLLNDRDVQVRPQAFVHCHMAAQVPVTGYGLVTPGNTPSIFQTYRLERREAGFIMSARAFWTVGHSSLNNTGLFAGRTEFRGKSNDVDVYNIRANFNDYVGLVGEQMEYFDDQGQMIKTGLVDEFGFIKANTANAIIAHMVNLYSNAGPRTSPQLRDTHAFLDANQYTPISERFYWDELEAALDSDRKITLFGGDCFVAIGHRRLYANTLERSLSDKNVPDRDAEDKVDVGVILSLCQESAHNPYLRSEKLVDVQEPAKRSFFPYEHREKPDFSAFRKTRTQESDAYNQGYSKTLGDSQHIVLPEGVPFLASHWFSRIAFFGPHIPNSFENAYRRYQGANYKDYDTAYGEITAVRNVNGVLHVLFERAVGVVPINERIQTGGDSAGAIFVVSGGVLGPLGLKSAEYGCRYQKSVKVTDNYVYFVDDSQNAICRYNTSPVEVLSLNTIDSELIKRAGSYRQGERKLFQQDICTSYDKQSGNVVLFSFYKKGVGEGILAYDNVETFTLAWSENLNCFYRVGFSLYGSFTIGDQLYGFSIRNAALRRNFFLHHSDITNPNVFYGETFPMILRYVVNAFPKNAKFFENIAILSNNVLPSVIRFWVQGATTTMPVRFDSERMRLSNARYTHGSARISIPKVNTVTNQDAISALLAELDNAKSEIKPGGVFRGMAMVIELEYTSAKRVRIESTTTYFTLSPY